jgi:hypothetical protein
MSTLRMTSDKRQQLIRVPGMIRPALLCRHHYIRTCGGRGHFEGLLFKHPAARFMPNLAEECESIRISRTCRPSSTATHCPVKGMLGHFMEVSDGLRRKRMAG